MDEQLIALYEVKRQIFLNGFIQTPAHYCNALAYAYYFRVAPIFHEGTTREHYELDPFESVYFVNSNFVDTVTAFIDQRQAENDYAAIEFYSLEDAFGGRDKRIELLYTLRYTRISERFDEAVWAAIERRAPAEASPIRSQFEPKDVYFG